MSSVVGHAAAGVAACLACHRIAHARALPVLPALSVFVLVAIAPDFDYLAVWFFGYSATPRFTHSLLFAVLVPSCAWWATRRLTASGGAKIPFAALLVAGLSHPALDLLVGAHPLPLFWPLPVAGVSAPGFLPSAGHLALGNRYLWRNLFIESAILFPAFAVAVAVARRVSWRTIATPALFVLPAWLLVVAWSIGLQR